LRRRATNAPRGSELTAARASKSRQRRVHAYCLPLQTSDRLTVSGQSEKGRTHRAKARCGSPCAWDCVGAMEDGHPGRPARQRRSSIRDAR